MINFTQRFVAITDTFNSLGGKILVKMGVEKSRLGTGGAGGWTGGSDIC